MSAPQIPLTAAQITAHAETMLDEQRIALAIRLVNSITDTKQHFGLVRLVSAARAAANDLQKEAHIMEAKR